MSRGTPDRTDKRVRRQNNLVCKSHSQKSGRTLNMKLSVRVRGDWIAVPCKGNEKISWFGEETLRRYYKAKAKHVDSQTEKVFEVRKAKGGAILDKDDSVKDVLDDNDFVTVGSLRRLFCSQSFLVVNLKNACHQVKGQTFFYQALAHLTLCPWENFHAFLSSAEFFFSKSTLSKKCFRNTIRVLSSLNPDQARQNVGPDLGPNCLQILSAGDTRSRKASTVRPRHII